MTKNDEMARRYVAAVGAARNLGICKNNTFSTYLTTLLMSTQCVTRTGMSSPLISPNVICWSWFNFYRYVIVSPFYFKFHTNGHFAAGAFFWHQCLTSTFCCIRLERLTSFTFIKWNLIDHTRYISMKFCQFLRWRTWNQKEKINTLWMNWGLDQRLLLHFNLYKTELWEQMNIC